MEQGGNHLVKKVESPGYQSALKFQSVMEDPKVLEYQIVLKISGYSGNDRV